MRAILLASLVALCVAGAIFGRRLAGGRTFGAILGFLLGVLLWGGLLMGVAELQLAAWRKMDQQIRQMQMKDAGSAAKVAGGGKRPQERLRSGPAGAAKTPAEGE